MTVDEHEAAPPLSRGTLFRDARTRLNPAALQEALRDPAARFAVLRGDQMLGEVQRASASSDQSAHLALLTAAELAEYDASLMTPERQFFLGRTHEGAPLFACHVKDAGESVIFPSYSDGEWLSLREHVLGLSDQDRGIFTTTLALSRWHESAEFSPATGSATLPEQGGWMRRDEQSGIEIYPRTDPAVIVLITDEHDRVLLGSHILWEENRYSLLAGFVEAGESLETAVHREIEEEAGILVTDVRYVASQPWPFPRSLMIGFTARLAAGQDSESIRPDETELADLHWFTREELQDADSKISLPGAASIARYLIDAWLTGPEGLGV